MNGCAVIQSPAGVGHPIFLKPQIYLHSRDTNCEKRLVPVLPFQTLKEFFTTSDKWKPQEEANLISNNGSTVEDGGLSRQSTIPDILGTGKDV